MISALEEQLAEVQRRNAQLDSELRAAQLTKLDMAASIAPVSSTLYCTVLFCTVLSTTVTIMITSITIFGEVLCPCSLSHCKNYY